jgi:hypothetical protein
VEVLRIALRTYIVDVEFVEERWLNRLEKVVRDIEECGMQRVEEWRLRRGGNV